MCARKLSCGSARPGDNVLHLMVLPMIEEERLSM